MTDWREDNPAGRLHIVLERLRTVGAGNQIREGWAAALGSPGAADVVLHSGIAEVFALIDSAEEQVRAIDGVNHDLFLRWTRPARDMMAYAGYLGSQLNEMFSHFSTTDMLSLEHCADLLHTRAPSPTLNRDRISDLIALVREAVDGISKDENLSAATKLYLVNRLREVEWALQNVDIVGYDGVNAAMDAFTGSVVSTPEARESADTRSWWRKVWDAFNSAATGTQQLTGAADSVIKLIESAGGGA